MPVAGTRASTSVTSRIKCKILYRSKAWSRCRMPAMDLSSDSLELFLWENVTALQVTSGSAANFARTLVSSLITSPRNYDCRNRGPSAAPT